MLTGYKAIAACSIILSCSVLSYADNGSATQNTDQVADAQNTRPQETFAKNNIGDQGGTARGANAQNTAENVAAQLAEMNKLIATLIDITRNGILIAAGASSEAMKALIDTTTTYLKTISDAGIKVVEGPEGKIITSSNSLEKASASAESFVMSKSQGEFCDALSKNL